MRKARSSPFCAALTSARSSPASFGPSLIRTPWRMANSREFGVRSERTRTDGRGSEGSALARARRRALGLAFARAGALLVSGLSLALLAGALVASRDGALFARIAAGALAFLAASGVVWFSLRSPLQRAAVRARDPRLLARLIGGPSELLSSVELTREDPRGVSTELLSLLHVRAAESARKLDLSRALPGSSLQGP